MPLVTHFGFLLFVLIFCRCFHLNIALLVLVLVGTKYQIEQQKAKKSKWKQDFNLNPIQYGLFLKHYGMGGAIMPPPPLVTLVFLKVEGQNLEA